MSVTRNSMGIVRRIRRRISLPISLASLSGGRKRG
jgi:hypothetical protein